MKKALLCVYSSLLFMSLISSCLLFALVAAEIDSNTTYHDIIISLNDDSVNIETRTIEPVEQGNSSKLVKDDNIPEEILSSFEDPSLHRIEPKVEETQQSDQTIPFQESTINQELSESGEGAVVYTLVDSATSELQQQAAASSSVPSQQQPQNKSVPVSVPLPLPSESDAPNTTSAQYIVRAEPKITKLPPQTEHDPGKLPETVTSEQEPVSNDTVTTTPPGETTTQHDAHEDIPSFSEWAQKQLEEAEKQKDENTTGGGGLPSGGGLKMRNKNYASPDCGSKVVAANPEAVSAGSLLSSSRDEYMLNTCTSRIWFIIELCEAIQPRKIELANFELFSSSPRDFTVSLSDRFPTRDWTIAGTFTAQDERNIQAFSLQHSNFFGKYVKVEIHSHYGTEHYCPVSLFRMYGTSEFEVLDTVEAHHNVVEDDDDDDDDEEVAGEGGDVPKNLFGSARDAVLSIVKKAAEALAKTPEESKDKDATFSDSNVTYQKVEEICVTPSYIVVCDNCSDQLFYKVYHLLSCHGDHLDGLFQSEFLRNTLVNSEVCSGLGLDLRSGAPFPEKPSAISSKPKAIDYLKTVLLPESLAAMCNILAIDQKKVVLNVSHEVSQETNKTQFVSNNTLEGVLLEPASTCSVDTSVPVSAPNTPELVSSFPTVTTNAGHVPMGQIKPTKTLTKEPHVSAPMDSPRIRNATITETNITVANAKPVIVQPSLTMEFNESKEMNQESIPTVMENISLPDVNDETTVDPLSLDSLFSELEKAVVPNLPVPAAVSPPQKESVFVRLANRIKALERNMSLSGQYLEELSRRYKRQVEEMQKALLAAVEERKRGEEREERTGEQLVLLSEKVASLTIAVENLINERDSWQHKASLLGQHGVIIVVEVFVFALVLYACRWLPNVEVSSRKFSVAWQRATVPERRKSVDDTVGNPKQRLKERRPSEEALKISGATHQELLIHDANHKTSKGETRRRRRKRKELAMKVASEMNGLDLMDREERSVLERNSTENITAWWEDDVFQNTSSLPLKSESDKVLPPVYVQTAVSQRQERLSRSTSSDVTLDHTKEQKATFLPIKKPGPFKKMVKKFF